MSTRLCLTWRILQSGLGTPSPAPQDLIPLSSMGFVGSLLLVTRTSNVRKAGPCATLDTTRSAEELRVVTYDVTPSLRGSLDQGIPLPPLPRYPEWYLPRAPHTGGEWTLTQWVHCEFVVSFEAIRPHRGQQSIFSLKKSCVDVEV